MYLISGTLFIITSFTMFLYLLEQLTNFSYASASVNTIAFVALIITSLGLGIYFYYLHFKDLKK